MAIFGNEKSKVSGIVFTTRCARLCSAKRADTNNPWRPLNPKATTQASTFKSAKRLILVDTLTLGLRMAIVVTPTSVQDRDGGNLLCQVLGRRCKKLRCIRVDGG